MSEELYRCNGWRACKTNFECPHFYPHEHNSLPTKCNTECYKERRCSDEVGGHYIYCEPVEEVENDLIYCGYTRDEDSEMFEKQGENLSESTLILRRCMYTENINDLEQKQFHGGRGYHWDDVCPPTKYKKFDNVEVINSSGECVATFSAEQVRKIYGVVPSVEKEITVKVSIEEVRNYKHKTEVE